MLDLARNSIILFFQGRLFREPLKVFRQILVGAVLTAAAVVALLLLARHLELSDPLATMVAAGGAGLFGGFLQPFLFKNLKYH